jgi:hypothetical protein
MSRPSGRPGVDQLAGGSVAPSSQRLLVHWFPGRAELKSVIGKNEPHFPPLWNGPRRWNTLSMKRMFADWLP